MLGGNRLRGPICPFREPTFHMLPTAGLNAYLFSRSSMSLRIDGRNHLQWLGEGGRTKPKASNSTYN